MRAAATLAALLLLAGPAQASDWAARCEAGKQFGEIAACERAQEERPNDPQILRSLGNAYFHADRFLESHQAYQSALRLTPRDAGLHYEYASLLVLVNEYTEGVREAETAVRLAPDHRASWSLLATCYRYMNQPQAALKATRRAAELGDRREAYALAHYHATGQEGAVRDPLLEMRWLERAAQAGHVEAMEDLSQLYAQGRPGIAPNSDKSRYWHKRAVAALN